MNPVGAHHESRLGHVPIGRPHALPESARCSVAQFHGPDGGSPSNPRAACCRDAEHGGIERRPVEADRGLSPGAVVAVGEAERGPSLRLDAHRRNRLRRLRQGPFLDAEPAQLRHGRRRSEDSAGAPVPRRLALEDEDVTAGVREHCREGRTREPSAHDRDLDAFRHHGSSSSTRPFS